MEDYRGDLIIVCGWILVTIVTECIDSAWRTGADYSGISLGGM